MTCGSCLLNDASSSCTSCTLPNILCPNDNSYTQGICNATETNCDFCPIDGGSTFLSNEGINGTQICKSKYLKYNIHIFIYIYLLTKCIIIHIECHRKCITCHGASDNACTSCPSSGSPTQYLCPIDLIVPFGKCVTNCSEQCLFDSYSVSTSDLCESI